MSFYIRRRKHPQRYLHLAIDSGGMTAFWVAFDQNPTKFNIRQEAEKFVVERFRPFHKNPNDQCWVDGEPK